MNAKQLLTDLENEKQAKLAAVEEEIDTKREAVFVQLSDQIEKAMKPALELFLSLPDDFRQQLKHTSIAEDGGDGKLYGVTFYERGRKAKRAAHCVGGEQ